MALSKTKMVKGIECSYWVITFLSWDKKSNTTQVALSLFKDQQSRSDSLENSLYGEGFTFDGYLSVEDCYEKIKQSNMSERPDDLPDGEEFTPEEQNWFADALDC